MSTLACQKNFSLHVEAGCGPSTDWMASPGSCRLRIKNYNIGDWNFTGCPTCNVSGLPDFNGEFPVFSGGGMYEIAVNTSIGGKQALAGNAYIQFFAGFWRLTLACQGAPSRYLWLGATLSATPIGIYSPNFVSMCGTAPISIEIEAYSL